MPVEVLFQPIVDKYERALEGPRLLFDLWPNPRVQGRPPKKLSALAGAVTLGVVGAFESFAEDLVAAVLLRRGHGWAHIAQNADLTNPSLVTVVETLRKTTGISVSAPLGWQLLLPRQTAKTAWADTPVGWAEVMRRSQSWIEVRHCLAHGQVTGMGAEIWPGPISRKDSAVYAALPSASDDDVLAWVDKTRGTRGLYLWPSISCARIFSSGAALIAERIAAEFGEVVDTDRLRKFALV